MTSSFGIGLGPLLNQKFCRRITPEFLYVKEEAAEKSTFTYSFPLSFVIYTKVLK